MNRAGGITVSPGSNSNDMIVVGIRLGGTPGCGVSIDGGTAGVGDSHEVEGENAGRPHRCSAGCDVAGGPNIAAVIKVVNMI